MLSLTACGPSGGDSDPSTGGQQPVQMPNQAPIANIDTFDGRDGVQISLPVLDNDNDPENQPLRISSFTNSTDGTVVLSDADTPNSPQDDFLLFQPNPSFVGTTTFSYTISDPDGLSATATVEVNITRRQGSGGNQVPLAVNDQATTLMDTALSVDVLANDSDPDGGTLSIQSITQPSNGVLVLDDNGTPNTSSDDLLSYTPNPGFSGQDSFVYDLFDGSDTARAAVTVLVATQATTPNISGHAPTAEAVVSVFAMDTQGVASGTPLAQTISDSGGNWALSLPARTEHLLIQVRAGILLHDSPGLNNVANARGVQLDDTIVLESLLLAERDTAAVTVLSNALLLNARNSASVLGFDQALASARTNFSAAFGLDPLLQTLKRPLLPSGDEATAQHIMIIGGAALQLDAAATQFLQANISGPMLLAQVQDLSDCQLDGRDANGLVEFQLAGVSVSYPFTDDLALTTLRYRNNFDARFANTPMPALDPAVCAVTDTVAPQFAPTASSIAVAAESFNGTGLGNDALTAIIDGVTATDNGQPIVVSNNAPAVFPIGDTLVTFTAVDLAGNTATFEVTIQIRDQDPPSITAPPAITIEATAQFTQVTLGQPTVSDNVSLSTDLIVSNDAPNTGFPIGVTTVNWTAIDEAGLVGSATQLVTLTINGAPEAVTPMFSATGQQGSLLSVQTANAFTDPDNDPLTYSISALPAGTGLSFDPTSGELSGVPSNADALASPINLNIIADDGASNVAATLELLIVNVNDAPIVIATLPDQSALSNQFVLIPTAFAFSDPDLDPITYSVSGIPTGLNASPASGEISGSVTTAAAAGSPYTITVVASDGSLSASTSFSLAVSHVNNAPVAVNPPGTQSATQGALYSQNLNNVFTDSDGDTLTLSALGLPASLNLGADSIIRGTPTNADAITGSFGITINADDGNGSVASVSFVLVVANVNDTPQVIAPIGNQSATVGTAYSLVTSTAFTDIDNDALIISVSGLPASLAVDSAGTISGTPTSADITASPFTIDVTATDPSGDSVSDTFLLSVSAVLNTPPTLTVPTALIVGMEDNVLPNIAVTIGDAETNPAALAVTVTSTNSSLFPVAGIVTGGSGANRTVTLTPATDAAGSATIAVTVSDGTDQTTETFDVQIDSVNDAPTFLPVPPLTIVEDMAGNSTLAPTLNSPPIDEAGQTVVWSLSPATVPFASISVDSTTGVIQISTVADGNGSQLFTLTADDGQSANNTSSEDFLVTVTPQQDAPAPADDLFATLFNVGQAHDVLDNDVDVDGETLQLSPASGVTSQGGSFVLNDAGTPADLTDDFFDYAPAIGFSGTDDYTYSVSDGIDSVTANVTVSVEPATLDNDGDGIVNGIEFTLANTTHACLDLNNPDSDGDGLSDGVEVLYGSDPCNAPSMQSILYLDIAGPSVGWPEAQASITALQSGTPGAPTFLLIAQDTINGEVRLTVDCSNLVIIGSLDPNNPGQTPQLDANGAPTTIFDMGGTRDSEIFDCEDAVISDVWFRNGGANAPGGGLEIGQNSSVELNRVYITDSFTTGRGAGLAVTGDANVSLNDSVIRSNIANGVGEGGGIFVGSNNALRIEGSTIINNTANGLGGGIFMEAGADVFIRDSLISGNNLTGQFGGGIYAESGGVLFLRSTIISGNRAGESGGGIYSNSADGDYLNVLITNNYASTSGGGLAFDDPSDNFVTNSTVAYNQTGGIGGGAAATNGEPVVRNSIFFNNRGFNRTLSQAAMGFDTYSATTDFNSNYNMVEVDQDGALDINLTALGRTPDFVNGYYLNQATSLAVNAGAAGSGAYGLNTFTTNPNGANDNGLVDLGYHYQNGADDLATSVELLEPSSGRLSVSASGPRQILLQPQTAAGDAISAAHQVITRVISAPPGFSFASSTGLEPVGPGSTLLDDLGHGVYQVFVNVSGLATTMISLELIVDGVVVDTITLPLDP